MMAEMQMMEFPKTVDEFMESYKIVDTEQVYTNGSELVPIFRMRQWFEHLNGADWISVKDRLPEEIPAKYLCFCRDGYMVGTYTAWGWMFPCYFGPVTHWMPLPEPPKEGES